MVFPSKLEKLLYHIVPQFTDEESCRKLVQLGQLQKCVLRGDRKVGVLGVELLYEALNQLRVISGEENLLQRCFLQARLKDSLEAG